jgi:hypothetical protein
VHRFFDRFRDRLARPDSRSTRLWSFLDRHYGRTKLVSPFRRAGPRRYHHRRRTGWTERGARARPMSPDMPVTYTYTKDGDRMVVTKVTLAKPLSYYEKKETETTTTTTKP